MRNPQAKTNELVGGRLLSKDEVLALLGNRAYSTVWQWMKDQQFPSPIELGPPGKRAATIAWIADEVFAWINSRPRRQIGRGQHQFVGKRDEEGRPVTNRRKKRTAAGDAR